MLHVNSRQTQHTRCARFAAEVENSDQEERTARGFSARKERREQRKKLKVEERDKLNKALEDIKTASVSKLLSTGEPKSAYRTILFDFVVSMGAPEEYKDLSEVLEWFQSTHRKTSTEVFKDPDRKLAKGFLEAIYTNRDYKNAFTSVLSMTSSEDSDDRPVVVHAAKIEALPKPISTIVGQHMKANIAHPMNSNSGESKERGQSEWNAETREPKKQKTEGQAQKTKTNKAGSNQEEIVKNEQEESL